MQPTVLLIDDCEDISKLVQQSLQPIPVTVAKYIKEAEDMIREKDFSLIIIDVELPDGSGYDLCARLAANPRTAATPKIFLTGKTEVAQKIFGLYSGADDYITKPFFTQELRARVDVKLRATPSASVVHMHGFDFDSDFQKCYLTTDGVKRDLGLTPTEFKIFLTLVKNEGSALSRQELVRHIWNAHGLNIGERGVDTHMVHLRKKISPHSSAIVSVYGKGYSFKSTMLKAA